MKSVIKTLCAAALASVALAGAQAKDLNKVGISVGSLGNPFFVATINGITDKAKSINPNVEVTSVSSDYDLNKQFSQIDNFIAAGVDIIMLNAVDPKAIAPAIAKAKAAGIVVAAFDVGAEGADVTVMTDNVSAGRQACQYIVDQLKGTGEVIIVNGPQVTSIADRVKGCKEAFGAASGIKVISDDQDGKASRDGGFAVGQALLTKFPKIDGIFAINDPTGIGVVLAAKQLNRNEFVLTGVDGSPDVEEELKKGAETQFKATPSQDPYGMAAQSLELAAKIMNGEKVEPNVILLEPKLITAENVGEYKGWAAAR